MQTMIMDIGTRWHVWIKEASKSKEKLFLSEQNILECSDVTNTTTTGLNFSQAEQTNSEESPTLQFDCIYKSYMLLCYGEPSK